MLGDVIVYSFECLAQRAAPRAPPGRCPVRRRGSGGAVGRLFCRSPLARPGDAGGQSASRPRLVADSPVICRRVAPRKLPQVVAGGAHLRQEETFSPAPAPGPPAGRRGRGSTAWSMKRPGAFRAPRGAAHGWHRRTRGAGGQNNLKDVRYRRATVARGARAWSACLGQARRRWLSALFAPRACSRELLGRRHAAPIAAGG